MAWVYDTMDLSPLVHWLLVHNAVDWSAVVRIDVNWLSLDYTVVAWLDHHGLAYRHRTWVLHSGCFIKIY